MALYREWKITCDESSSARHDDDLFPFRRRGKYAFHFISTISSMVYVSSHPSWHPLLSEYVFWDCSQLNYEASSAIFSLHPRSLSASRHVHDKSHPDDLHTKRHNACNTSKFQLQISAHNASKVWECSLIFRRCIVSSISISPSISSFLSKITPLFWKRSLCFSFRFAGRYRLKICPLQFVFVERAITHWKRDDVLLLYDYMSSTLMRNFGMSTKFKQVTKWASDLFSVKVWTVFINRLCTYSSFNYVDMVIINSIHLQKRVAWLF